MIEVCHDRIYSSDYYIDKHTSHTGLHKHMELVVYRSLAKSRCLYCLLVSTIYGINIMIEVYHDRIYSSDYYIDKHTSIRDLPINTWTCWYIDVSAKPLSLYCLLVSTIYGITIMIEVYHDRIYSSDYYIDKHTSIRDLPINTWTCWYICVLDKPLSLYCLLGYMIYGIIIMIEICHDLVYSSDSTI